MEKHPDSVYRRTILNIIRCGARIGYTGPKQRIISPNLSSAKDAPEVLSKYLDEQIQHHRVVPVREPPPHFMSSPLGLVPKPNGKWRRIHHLSHPRKGSVNYHIPAEWGALEYTSFDEALEALLDVGRGAYLVKRDLADAFRHIPVARADWWLLGFQWNNSYWMDIFLPFGLRTSSFIFDLFAKGINWILVVQNWLVLHYLDDFLAIVKTSEEASRYESAFDTLCDELGMRINASKGETGQICDFLGLTLDTQRMEARLPPDKLKKAIEWVNSALTQDYMSKDELRSLLGFLSFAAKVVKPGRAFYAAYLPPSAKTRVGSA